LGEGECFKTINKTKYYMQKLKIILGSSSRWRQQLLIEAGYRFTVMHANLDERQIRHPDPKELALTLAYAKAKVLIPKITEPALLITVDQVVVCNGEVFEKPETADEARKFMHFYNEHPAQTITAVVVTNTLTKKQAAKVDVVNVQFNFIPEAIIEQFIADSEIFSCAGGFQIEGRDGKLNQYIKAIDGAVDSVKGLPLKMLKELINLVIFSDI
jgi:septum formation protein